jgi:hypothetical protein
MLNPEFHNFILTPKGQEAMRSLAKAADLIKAHPVPMDSYPLEFRQMFVKYLLNMLMGLSKKF